MVFDACATFRVTDPRSGCMSEGAMEADEGVLKVSHVVEAVPSHPKDRLHRRPGLVVRNAKQSLCDLHRLPRMEKVANSGTTKRTGSF